MIHGVMVVGDSNFIADCRVSLEHVNLKKGGLLEAVNGWLFFQSGSRSTFLGSMKILGIGDAWLKWKSHGQRGRSFILTHLMEEQKVDECQER
jgi:hypothetical protein